MAGDWIKMELCLARKPEVIGMADRLGLDEFAVVASDENAVVDVASE